MRLTDLKIRSLKASAKDIKVSDGLGLYLIIKTNGSKLWRFRYRFAGKENMLSLGRYPETSLKDARLRRDEMRLGLRQFPPTDPAQSRRLAVPDSASLFQRVADEYLESHRPSLSPSTYVRDRRILDKVCSQIGKLSISEISPTMVLSCIRKIEESGAGETARRALRLTSRVFRYGIASGIVESDPTAALGNALKPVSSSPMPAITQARAYAELIKAIRTYDNIVVRLGLLLLAHTFVRPSELRLAEWKEFDHSEKLWLIPADRTKMRREHYVPLSSEVLAILNELKRVDLPSQYILPGTKPGKPLSENTFNQALASLGYGGGRHVAHGFRASASTLLHEFGHDPMVIETQLAHKRHSVAGVYNRSVLLPQRRRLMQEWSTWIESNAERVSRKDKPAGTKPHGVSLSSLEGDT